MEKLNALIIYLSFYRVQVSVNLLTVHRSTFYVLRSSFVARLEKQKESGKRGRKALTTTAKQIVRKFVILPEKAASVAHQEKHNTLTFAFYI